MKVLCSKAELPSAGTTPQSKLGPQMQALWPKADHSLFAALDPSVSIFPAVSLLCAFCIQLFITELVRPCSLFWRWPREETLVFSVIHNHWMLNKRSPEKQKRNPDWHLPISVIQIHQDWVQTVYVISTSLSDLWKFSKLALVR